MPLQIVLLGPPASGKGTQGRRLAAAFGLDYLGTGALLRGILERGGPLEPEIRPILDRGGYLPDALMGRIMSDWLADHPGGWVLDGFPRTRPQAALLEAWLDQNGASLDAAVALEAPKKQLIERLEGRVECPDCHWTGRRRDTDTSGRCPMCGGPAERRHDDSHENFLSRHDEFLRHALPVIDDYAAQGLLVRCDAAGGIGQVAGCLERYIRKFTSDGQKT